MSFSLKSATTNRSILLQLGILLLICQLVAHLLSVAFVVWRYERPDLLRTTSVSTVAAVTIHDLLMAADPNEQALVGRLLERAGSEIKLVTTTGLTLQDAGALFPEVLPGGLARVAPQLADKLRGVANATAGSTAALLLDGNRALLFDPRVDLQAATIPRVVPILMIMLTVVPLAALSFWAAMMLTAPLRRLAQSADRFAIDLDATPLTEQGPAEIRKLAHAFNAMKTRIRQLVESRSRMLAAVSHDLRTPLTRLRLRAEGLVDGEDRERMLRDVDTMDRMIGHSLSYLRDQASAAKHERVDLPALIESICDDFVDTGRDASLSGQRHIVIECEPDLITRAMSNLIENAIKFGDSAEVSIGMRSASEVVINVRDQGPGIPDEAKLHAFEPFSRGDSARSGVDTDGFGLGLAIAKQIIERHGGQITLHDREPAGLDVQIVLPMAPASRSAAQSARLAAALAGHSPTTWKAS